MFNYMTPLKGIEAPEGSELRCEGAKGWLAGGGIAAAINHARFRSWRPTRWPPAAWGAGWLAAQGLLP